MASALSALPFALAVAAEPVPQAVYLLGSCYFEMGKVSAAIRQLEEAVRIDPSFHPARHIH